MTTATYGYPIVVHEKAQNYLQYEILANQTVLIDTILARHTCDDITGGRRENIENLIDYSEDTIDEFLQYAELEAREISGTYAHKRKLAAENGFEGEQKEVYERWLVTDRLAKQLTSIGEVVLFADSGNYWGRCTTGQAILLDGVLQDIATQSKET